MLAGIRKRLARKQLGIKECEDDDKDDLHATAFSPPTNYIKISQGKIHLVHQPPPPPMPYVTAQSPVATLSNKGSTTTTTNGYHHHQHQYHQQHQHQQHHQTYNSGGSGSGSGSAGGGSGDSGVIETPNDKDNLESRIIELEAALLRLQDKINKSQCGSPTFERELRQQLENMNRVMKSKERKQLQTCRDHKALQTRFARQENLLHALQQENKALMSRVRQYEHCLDDVMRKVVDAIVAEDNLREEVALLKSRVRDLEAQNAALSASPAKGRDEGYCTMSSGQPQPSNGHLEDLPEEPEQWLLPAEPCSTEMEDWSMSQEELAVITLDEGSGQAANHRQQHQRKQHLKSGGSIGGASSINGDHDWLWNSNDLLNSTMVETDNISQLLQQKIIYSEDEEVTCTEFTNDFYKLVNIRSSSARSLYSYVEDDTDDEDDDDEDDEDDDDDDDVNQESDNENDIDGNSSLSPSHKRLRTKMLKSRQKPPSPTPSEAGRAQVTSCSSSETDDISLCTTTTNSIHTELPMHPMTETNLSCSSNENVVVNNEIPNHIEDIVVNEGIVEQHQQNCNSNNIAPPLSPIKKHHTNHQRHLSEHMTEKECIEQIIKTELSRTPKRHKLMKSQSTIEEREACYILAGTHSPQHQNSLPTNESKVIRSGSVNGNLAMKTSKFQERLQNANNSWRKSNGWKRVMSPARSPISVSPKKEAKTTELKSPANKTIPTRIPSCISPSSYHQSSANHQPTKLLLPSINVTNNHTSSSSSQLQSPTARKSKIPPPVPVRRSYAS